MPADGGASASETGEDFAQAPGPEDLGTRVLVVAFLALGAAIGSVILGVRANRRTVSS